MAKLKKRKGEFTILTAVQRNILSLLGLVIAAVFGICAQDISYYLNDKIPAVPLRTAITAVTFLSLALFTGISAYHIAITKTKAKSAAIIAVAGSLTGIPISVWSVFVWAMWIG